MCYDAISIKKLINIYLYRFILFMDWRLRRSKPSSSSLGSDTGRSSSILQAVVGYLGTIELSLDSTAGLQVYIHR